MRSQICPWTQIFPDMYAGPALLPETCPAYRDLRQFSGLSEESRVQQASSSVGACPVKQILQSCALFLHISHCNLDVQAHMADAEVDSSDDGSMIDDEHDPGIEL